MVSSYAKPAEIPSWITLGQIVTGVGAIIIFIGFLLGYAAVASSGSSYQGDLESFFVVTGLGILLVIGGWLFDSIWPKFQSRPRPSGTPLPPPPPPPAA